MVLKNIQEAEAALAKYIPMVKEMTGRDITLDRIRVLLAAVGNPHTRLRVIHVAGTSGKTSTAYYIASLLGASGKKIGLTVSPHIDTITERVQVNSMPLAEAEFCGALGELLDLIEAVAPEPSYFELLIAFAYWYFDKTGVDYAVVETGMGGLHDGTNIAARADKVCVITDIGLDHTHILGTTVEEISAQKAGIIYPGNKAFMYGQAPAVNEVFIDYAQRQGAELWLLDQSELAQELGQPGLQDLPLYQQRNWLLARAASQYVAERDGLELSASGIADSLAVQVPGRMDKISVKGKTVIMDGAHNEQKIRAFVESFLKEYPAQRVPILLSLKQGKEYQSVLPLLKPICSQLVVTTFDVLQDLPSISIDPTVVAESAESLGFQNVQVVPDPNMAFRTLLELPGDLAVVTGSFYLLSCIRPGIINP